MITGQIKEAYLSLENARLDATAATYPEQMREPFIWFGAYVREKCAKNVDVLEAKLKAFGFSTTASTFSKILRGRWNTDANGNTIAPVMKLNNFLQIVERLRSEDKLEDLAGKVPFVETEVWEMIRDYIDIRRAPDRICKFGLILGPTGAQKTACFQEYRTRNNHGACVWLEAPYKGSQGEFISDLAEQYGCSPWLNLVRQRQRIAENVKRHNTIIVDNVQRLYMDNQGWNQPVFNYLQKLQDTTGCTIIMSATLEFGTRLQAGIGRGYFEQFEGRCGGAHQFLVLPGTTTREDVLLIAKAFGLQEPAKHVKYLEQLAAVRGRCRILFGSLQEAKRDADASGEKLTIDHVKAATSGIDWNKSSIVEPRKEA
jgi:hypothetical protein